MNQKTKFSPSSYSAHDDELKGYSQEDIDRAKHEVELEMAKKNKRLRAFEIAWAIISTIFAIISTSILLTKKWVDGVVSYIILGLLIAHVMIFIVLCAFVYKHPANTAGIKVYGKFVKIFKALANIAFLVLAAMTMAAIVKENKSLNFGQWVIFLGNMILAVVKLVIKIISLIRYFSLRHTAKNYSVKIERYVDGEAQQKTRADRRYEKKFK